MSEAIFTLTVLAIVVAFVVAFHWTLRLIDRALSRLSSEEWPTPLYEPRNPGVEPVGERGD